MRIQFGERFRVRYEANHPDRFMPAKTDDDMFQSFATAVSVENLIRDKLLARLAQEGITAAEDRYSAGGDLAINGQKVASVDDQEAEYQNILDSLTPELETEFKSKAKGDSTLFEFQRDLWAALEFVHQDPSTIAEPDALVVKYQLKPNGDRKNPSDFRITNLHHIVKKVKAHT